MKKTLLCLISLIFHNFNALSQETGGTYKTPEREQFINMDEGLNLHGERKSPFSQNFTALKKAKFFCDPYAKEDGLENWEQCLVCQKHKNNEFEFNKCMNGTRKSEYRVSGGVIPLYLFHVGPEWPKLFGSHSQGGIGIMAQFNYDTHTRKRGRQDLTLFEINGSFLVAPPALEDRSSVDVAMNFDYDSITRFKKGRLIKGVPLTLHWGLDSSFLSSELVFNDFTADIHGGLTFSNKEDLGNALGVKRGHLFLVQVGGTGGFTKAYHRNKDLRFIRGESKVAPTNRISTVNIGPRLGVIYKGPQRTTVEVEGSVRREIPLGESDFNYSSKVDMRSFFLVSERNGLGLSPFLSLEHLGNLPEGRTSATVGVNFIFHYLEIVD